MSKLTICLFVFAGVLLATFSKAQDPHFGGWQDMNIWYNPALKIDKVPLARFSLRNVTYPNIISYSSKALTFELPIVGKDVTDYNNISFVNLAIGISTDNSNEQFMAASTAMMSLSFALPLNDKNTYVALGLQGNYSFNRIGTGASFVFPDDFDKYGALGWAMMRDPFLSGLNYEYFSAGIGVAFFHSGQQEQWYLGGSSRYFNHPYTEWEHSDQLPSDNGIQVGYTSAVDGLNYISGYGNFTWQAGINEQFVAARYIRHLNDSSNNAFSIGLGYSAGDALVPEATLEIRRSRVAFYEEINLSGIYQRKAFGFSFRFNL